MSVEEAIQKCFDKQDETGVMYTLPDDFPAFVKIIRYSRRYVNYRFVRMPPAGGLKNQWKSARLNALNL